MKPTTIDHDELLERKANIARRRLMHTVDELDARKNAVERKALLPIGAAALGALWLMSRAGRGAKKWNARRRRRAAFRRILKTLHLR